MAKVHHGSVYLESSEEFLTIFTLKLPRYTREAAPSESISTGIFKRKALKPESQDAA